MYVGNLYCAVRDALEAVEISDGECWSHNVEEVTPDITRFQLVCWLHDTTIDVRLQGGQSPQEGRWFYLESGADKAHIVRTIWLAYQTFMHHEMLERFRFNGKLIFNPHFDI